MGKKILIILILCLGFGSTVLFAGWYECYNFKGMIDKYPITLSIQVRAGYFGAQDKQHYNVIGVYKYDKYNKPIRLEGSIDFKTNKALLYEISADKPTATLAFDFSKEKSTGTWQSMASSKTLPLQLWFVSELADTAAENQFANVDILQSGSLSQFYFVGQYSKTQGAARAQMNQLSIIQKKDNAVFQIIDFSKIESPTGNVMTIIFDNISVIDPKKQTLYLSNSIGRTGGYLIITYDPKTKRFKLDPEPKVDGPE